MVNFQWTPLLKSFLHKNNFLREYLIQWLFVIDQSLSNSVGSNKITIQICLYPLDMRSDHLSFRLRGFPNALTLSLLPSDGIQAIEKTLAGANPYSLIFRHRPIMPEPLSVIHTSKDTSSNLNEKSLNLMRTLLLEI